MLTLLLAFAVGFSCIGCAAWFCTKGQIADIDADYTTIAVPLPQNNEYITQRWLNVGGLPGEDGSFGSVFLLMMIPPALVYGNNERRGQACLNPRFR